jgi:hypothetical protein
VVKFGFFQGVGVLELEQMAEPRAKKRAEHDRSVLALHRDALSETLDAVPTGEPATSLVGRGLAP